ncbi:glycosyltransferase [Sedimentibacter sp.]|uniref:glycosyltransferase family 2 protein n=1 Tax=Sedimentibacter sp. TaxID=1960295 RepID=UPI00289FDEDB|nr:glycosyltransferase [Sedimentibacter sp.]
MLKNQPIIDHILDMIETMIEAAYYMYKNAILYKYSEIENIANELINMLNSIYPNAIRIKKEIPYIATPISCENLVYLLINIIKLVRMRSDKVTLIIEFELIPIIKEFYDDFYFFTSVFGDRDKEKMYYAKEYIELGANYYIDESMKIGNYKYDVSIYVLAYNKIEYTKQCVESIIKYTPQDIKYEIILINNGSTDETKSYFDSLKCNKEITLLKNTFSDIKAARRIFEGRYVLSVSNDVIVTENYLDNLIRCIESDPEIAMVVPTTSNVSNFQSIPAQYSTIEEMHEFAKNNNIPNPLRWEERTRLCNPIALYRSDILYSSSGVGSIDKYFVYSEFGDDALALRLRRAGFKMILAKDCYCYHFGSVTLKEAQVKENTLEKSRKLFIDRYGVDAWSTGFCFSLELIKEVPIKTSKQVNILGINSGFGSNPLKIKDLNKENGNPNVEIYFLTDDERYILDMKAYSSNVIHTDDIFTDYFDNVYFDYILLEDNIMKVLNKFDNINRLKEKLSEKGILAVYIKNVNSVKDIKDLKSDKVVYVNNSDCWYMWFN